MNDWTNPPKPAAKADVSPLRVVLGLAVVLGGLYVADLVKDYMREKPDEQAFQRCKIEILKYMHDPEKTTIPRHDGIAEGRAFLKFIWDRGEGLRGRNLLGNDVPAVAECWSGKVMPSVYYLSIDGVVYIDSRFVLQSVN